MLSISSRKKINIINYLGIGAINGGALNKNYIPYLKKKKIPIKLYDNYMIYDKINSNEHKFNKDDNYYMKTQNGVIKKNKQLNL